MKKIPLLNYFLVIFVLLGTAEFTQCQTLEYLDYVEELDASAASVQFQNVATGQYIVLKASPGGGGALEANDNPDPVGWYFHQGNGADANNFDVKRKGVVGFNWANYNNADDNYAAIAWNHAKRIPSATAPQPPHDYYLEQVSKSVFRIKWRHAKEYLELMPNLKLTNGTGPKIITRALNTSNQHQLWKIKVSSKGWSCEGKQFKVDENKNIWEKRNDKWVEVGNRCNELKCSNQRVFCVSTDGSFWRYNGQPQNWTPANTLLAGQVLNGGMNLRASSGMYFFYMQADGNLEIRTNDPNSKNVWNSNTGNKGTNCLLEMQTDGNLVAYNANKKPIWNAETHSFWNPKYSEKKYKPTKLVLEDDGKLVLYSETGFRVWDNVKGKFPLN